MNNPNEPQHIAYTPSNFTDAPVANDAPTFFTEDNLLEVVPTTTTTKRDNLRIVVLISSIIILIGNSIWCGWGLFTENLPVLDYASTADIIAFITRLFGLLVGIAAGTCGIMATMERFSIKIRRTLLITNICCLVLLILIEVIFWIAFLNTVTRSDAQLIGIALIVLPIVAVLGAIATCGTMSVCSGIWLRGLKNGSGKTTLETSHASVNAYDASTF
jgi:hypothetical protein